jgi:hypothetical protein
MRSQAEWDHLRLSDPEAYNLCIQADEIAAAGGIPAIVDSKAQKPAAQQPAGLTKEDIRSIFDEWRGPLVRGLVGANKEYVEAQLAPLRDRLTKLEATTSNLKRKKEANDAAIQ